MTELPSFDELRSMAEKDPEALSQFRHQVCEEFIRSIPVQHQARLRSVQWRVDVELRRAKTPMAGLMRLTSMMYDSMLKMGESIQALDMPPGDLSESGHRADIVDFTNWRREHDIKQRH